MKPAARITLCLLVVAIVPSLAFAADTTTGSTTTAAKPASTTAAQPQMTMAEVKKKLGIVVFPAKNQDAKQQEADELACLQWGADQAGVHPGDKAPDAKAAGDAAAAKVDSAATGAAVKGAAKGAAAGAIFGAIAGDTGTGAAIGAAGGAMAGRKAKKQAKANASAQAEAKVTADQQKKLDEVKKGMAACLESKGYTVK